MQKLLTFFQQKYWHIWDINAWNFNITLTNDIVSFEQLGPGVFLVIMPMKSRKASHCRRVNFLVYTCFCVQYNMPVNNMWHWYTISIYDKRMCWKQEHVARSKIKVGHSRHLKFVHSRLMSDPELHHAWWDLKIIRKIWSSRQDIVSRVRTIQLGQRLRSQPAL